MDRIVDHVLAFEGDGKIRDFVGNFSEYREAKSREDALEKNAAVKPEPVKEIAVTESFIFRFSKKKINFQRTKRA
jgi:ATP-binding cassette subfamily F protein uup